MKKLLMVVFMVVCGFMVVGVVYVGEVEVCKVLQDMFGDCVKVDVVCKFGIFGFYEVQIGGDIVYVDENGCYVFFGDVVDLKSCVNLIEECKIKFSQIKFFDLLLNMVIKQVCGNGKCVFVFFEDLNCGYCKKFVCEMQNMIDVIMYVFFYLILGVDLMEKLCNIFCFVDLFKVWNEWMLNGVVLLLVLVKCDVLVEKYIVFG